jgi:hypothetical protein
MSSASSGEQTNGSPRRFKPDLIQAPASLLDQRNNLDQQLDAVLPPRCLGCGDDSASGLRNMGKSAPTEAGSCSTTRPTSASRPTSRT